MAISSSIAEAARRNALGEIVKRIVVRKDVCTGCRACEVACVASCPTGALRKDEGTGAVLVEADDCTGCSACVEACPFGAVTLHAETGLALICDLCGGEPACVKRCATGAIVYAGSRAESRAKRETPSLGRG